MTMSRTPTTANGFDDRIRTIGWTIALTAIGFLWFYDPQASIFNWFLIKLHLVDPQHLPNWLGTPKAAMSSIITVQAWRTIPFATVIFLAGISSIPQEVDDAAAIDGANPRRAVR